MNADLAVSPHSLLPSSRAHSRSVKSLLTSSLDPLQPPPTCAPIVLVVDDNKMQRQIHKRMVAQEGYECDIAISGSHAIDLARKGNYCLVLMDLMMHPLDGWKTAKILGSFSSPPPIVAVTGLGLDEGLREQCAAAGMDEVLQKPISAKCLNYVLHKYTLPLRER